MINIQGLSQYYGKKIVLNDVHLEVGEKERCALVGRNGSGKSTLIHSMLGLLPVKKGWIMLGGHCTKGTDKWKKEVAYLPEKFHLYPQLTASENLRFFAELQVSSGEGNWTVQLENEPVYERGEKTEIMFTVLDGETPVNDLEISALLEMSRMNHGHIEVYFTNGDNGVYFGEVELAMPGEWIASLTIVSGTDEYEKVLEFEVGEGHD